MMRISISILMVFLSIGLGCIQCAQEEKPQDNFVIEAYIFSNEPVRNIKITQPLPIAAVETEPTSLTQATVILKKLNQEYSLHYDPVSATYLYPGSNLEVKPGDLFELIVTNQTRVASASTVVPLATRGLRLSDNKIHIPQIQLSFSTKDQLTYLFANARLKATWDNQENQLHFIAIESLDKFDPIFPTNFPPGVVTLFRTFRYVSSPNRNDTYDIVGLSLETYGRYRVKVYRVNKEYADLFENQSQDSRDLNAPPSNVNNAFGIFSAFASDSAFFEVVRN